MSQLLVVPASPVDAPKPRLPVLRLSENFFQRWFLILLPVVLMALIGVMLTQRLSPSYLASATLSTSANPLVGATEIRGTTTDRFGESPAELTARVLAERMGTDRFASGVAERVGLLEAIENEFVTYDDLRQQVNVIPIGESLVIIEARWGDPETSLDLVDAMIAQYLSLLQSTISADAQSAVDFYQSVRAEAVAAADEADVVLQEFLDELPVLPAGVERDLVDQLSIDRLNDQWALAQAKIAAVDLDIEEAELSLARAQSESGRSIEIVDPAAWTGEAESDLMNRAIIFVAFVFLGGLMALTILLLSTYLDRSVRSAGDIEAAGGGVTVAAVPVIKSLRPRNRALRVLGQISHRRAG